MSVETKITVVAAIILAITIASAIIYGPINIEPAVAAINHAFPPREETDNSYKLIGGAEVYEFTPKMAPHKQCVFVDSSFGDSGGVGLSCFDKKMEELK